MLRSSKLFRFSSLLVAFTLLLLLAPARHAGQTTNDEIKATLADIALLKQVVAQQDQRISELERVVKSLQTTAERSPAQGGINQPKTEQKPSALWMIASNWGRVKDGMSQAQVIAILGQPTSIDDIGPFRTLFYRGEAPGSGFVSGNVKLSDDRVWDVNIPVF